MRFYYDAPALEQFEVGTCVRPDPERVDHYFRVTGVEGIGESRRIFVQGRRRVVVAIGPNDTLGFAAGAVWRCLPPEEYSNPLRRLLMRMFSREEGATISYWEHQVWLSPFGEYARPKALQFAPSEWRLMATGTAILPVGAFGTTEASIGNERFTRYLGGEALIVLRSENGERMTPTSLIVRPSAIGLDVYDIDRGTPVLRPLREWSRARRAALRVRLAERLELMLDRLDHAGRTDFAWSR